VRTNAPCVVMLTVRSDHESGRASAAVGAPTSGAAGVGRAPGARTEGSTPGRTALYNGGAAQKRLQVVLDEKSPTYAPPTFVRVTPAELVAVGDE